MVEEVIVPKLGMAAARVTLTEWKAKEGDRVNKDDSLLDIEAEKSVFDMPAPATGFLHILYDAGVETDVNTVVGYIAETEEEYAALKRGADDESTPEAAPEKIAATIAPAAPVADRGFIASSPIARKTAREHDIDITQIVGTGPKGRIVKEDVLREAEARKSRPPAAATKPAEPSIDFTQVQDDKKVKETIPYRGMRRAIGENMMKSLAINAPNTFSGEFDLTELAKWREHFVSEEQKIGVRITYSDMLLYAVAKALKQFPLMNSSLIGDEIILWDEINLGMAVALGEYGEKGLIVPKIKGADKKSLIDISKTAKDLGEKARAGKLMPDETTGGTFTVSNFGSLGVSAQSTPIINPPESGILGIGRLTKKPVVRNDQIVIAPMLPYSLTHDHRITDGAAAEYFLGTLKNLVENPSSLILR